MRVVDVFVDELNLGALRFEGVDPAATGRPAYLPAILLKIHIHGDLLVWTVMKLRLDVHEFLHLLFQRFLLPIQMHAQWPRGPRHLLTIFHTCKRCLRFKT